MGTRRVLVVDDNPDSAGAIAFLLKLSGHEVQIAHDGAGAIALARRMRPDFLFLDLGLPGMDGFEVARQLKAEPGFDGMRIIAVTGSGNEDDRQRSREAGIEAFLVKPVDPSFLDSLLGGRR
jgi:CheY-like chemotaxis protein